VLLRRRVGCGRAVLLRRPNFRKNKRSDVLACPAARMRPPPAGDKTITRFILHFAPFAAQPDLFFNTMKTIPMKNYQTDESRASSRLRCASPRQGVESKPNAAPCNLRSCHVSRFTFHASAFTIVELLTVIAIIGILAAMLLPVLSRAKIAAQKKQAAVEISQIVGAIQQYDSVYGRFPVSLAAQNQASQNAQNNLNPDFTYGGTFQTPSGNPYPIGTQGLMLTNDEVIAILMDLTNYPNGSLTVNTNHQKNPQQTIFLNAKMAGDTNSPGVGTDLVYRDPWGNPYVISMDLNYDEQCRDAFYCLNLISGTVNPGLNGLVSPEAAPAPAQNDFQYHGKVMVWSAGPDRKIDPNLQANQGYNKDNVLSWQ
jgi:prepilin-type N-terminal cleavage/methylation domain-containing protein